MHNLHKNFFVAAIMGGLLLPTLCAAAPAEPAPPAAEAPAPAPARFVPMRNRLPLPTEASPFASSTRNSSMMTTVNFSILPSTPQRALTSIRTAASIM